MKEAALSHDRLITICINIFDSNQDGDATSDHAFNFEMNDKIQIDARENGKSLKRLALVI